mgnify:CR=1 FL=1
MHIRLPVGGPDRVLVLDVDVEGLEGGLGLVLLAHFGDGGPPRATVGDDADVGPLLVAALWLVRRPEAFQGAAAVLEFQTLLDLGVGKGQGHRRDGLDAAPCEGLGDGDGRGVVVLVIATPPFF